MISGYLLHAAPLYSRYPANTTKMRLCALMNGLCRLTAMDRRGRFHPIRFRGIWFSWVATPQLRTIWRTFAPSRQIHASRIPEPARPLLSNRPGARNSLVTPLPFTQRVELGRRFNFTDSDRDALSRQAALALAQTSRHGLLFRIL